jgi:hypothetical protein
VRKRELSRKSLHMHYMRTHILREEIEERELQPKAG